MAIGVKWRGRGSDAFAFIACLAMTWACGPRTTPAAVPPAVQAPEPPAAPAVEPPRQTSTPAQALEPDAAECALVAEPGEAVETVALTDRVDPANAPRPSNDGERVLFRQLYETLVRADCRGRVLPALAASWQLEADGRTWVVTLREGARFSDGSAVTATDVRAAWTRDATGAELRPEASRLIESVAPSGTNALAIVLRSRRADVPMALAHPDLAVAKVTNGSPWPLGTRSARVAADSGATAPAQPREITVVRDNLPAVRFLAGPGDPRDLLDRGVDLLITRDPAALSYAATLPHLQSFPLPWQHTYVLAMPGRARSLPSLSEEQRQVFAVDAVRGEARGARAPFWWQAVPECPVSTVPAPVRAPTPRVVYDAGDSTARDLAERLVGLGRVASPAATVFLDVVVPDRRRRSFQRAAGLSGAALALARRQGADVAYVMTVESQPIDACRDLQALVDRARWIDPETVVPLVETRPRAIVRRGRSGVVADWDGAVVITGASGAR